MIGDSAGPRAWRRVGLLLFATGWGGNHIAPLLLVYRQRLALDAAAPQLMLAAYALGLIPGLLLAGPLSDRRGRRAVVLPAATLALAASVVLGGLGDYFGALLAGRFVYGLGAGGVMSAGATWVIELSADAAPGTGARRATVALSSGFGFGPLVAGLIAQYAPAPTVLPFAIHVGVLATMLGVARRAPDTGGAGPALDGPAAGTGRDGDRAALRRGRSRPLFRIELDRAGWRRFLRAVVPMAPFVFAFPMIVIAALPSMLGSFLGAAPIAYAGLLSAVTLAAGVLAQPITRRFAPVTAARLGLAIGSLGIALGMWSVASHTSAALLAVAPILGAAYGIAMTAGLSAVQRLAHPDARGGITGLYYVLTYVGFATPYALALASRITSPATALGATLVLAVLVAATLPRAARSAR